ALLAWLGVLAVPTRVLAECPMLGDDAGARPHHAVAATPAAAGQVASEGHGGHEGHEATAPASDEASASEQSDGAPEHSECPDLAHCAVVALTTASTQARAEPSGLDVAKPFTPDAPHAPARAIEPPPPKR